VRTEQAEKEHNFNLTKGFSKATYSGADIDINGHFLFVQDIKIAAHRK